MTDGKKYIFIELYSPITKLYPKNHDINCRNRKKKSTQCYREVTGRTLMKEELTKLIVQAQPSARRNELLSFKQGVLKVKIAASPVKGKANQELISYLSKVLGIAKSQIIIKQGAASKKKLIIVRDLNQDQLLTAITGWLNKK